MLKKVSIIVPIYNVDLYLDKCLSSVVTQTYNNIEIVLVNDGSTDRSLEIAEYFAQRDDRIVLYSQTNGGLSVARNTGMKLATGEYVLFLDSDDWLSEKAIDVMYKQISRNEADILCCRSQFENLLENKIAPSRLKTLNALCGDNILKDALLSFNFHTSAWAKMYRRSFLLKNQLFFKDGIVNEDTLFSIQTACMATKVSFINNICFHILEREGSISRSSQERLFRDMDTALTLAKDFLIAHKRFDAEIEALFYARYVKSMLYNLLQITQRLPFSEYIRIYKICINETSYLKYSKNVGLLSSLHYLLFYASKSPRMFFLLMKIANFFHFRMH